MRVATAEERATARPPGRGFTGPGPARDGAPTPPRVEAPWPACYLPCDGHAPRPSRRHERGRGARAGRLRQPRGPLAARGSPRGAPRGPAHAPDLRQPEPPDGPDRGGRLRHGLHAGDLPPAPARDARLRDDAGADDPLHGLPGGARRPAVRSGVRHPRRGGGQAVRQHLQDGPAQPRGPLLPRPYAARRRRDEAAVPGREDPPLARRASPGSTRSSRSPRPACSRS